MAANDELFKPTEVVEFEKKQAADAQAKATKEAADKLLGQKLEGEAIPQALRGKSLADVFGMLQERDQRLADQAKMIDSHRATLDEIKADMQKMGQAQQPPGQKSREELEQEQFDQIFDPNAAKALHGMFDRKIAPLVGELTAIGKTQAKQAAQNFIVSRVGAEAWTRLEGEVDKVMEQVRDPMILARPDSWVSAAVYALGQEQMKTGTERGKADNMIATPDKKPSLPPAEVPLSAEEEEAQPWTHFGMSKEQWKAYR